MVVTTRGRFSLLAFLSLAACALAVPGAGAGGAGENPPFRPIAQPAAARPGAVDIALISNGCGGGAHLVGVQNSIGDSSVYRNSINPFGMRYKVLFRPACNLHDAGYSGAYVWDNISGRWVDFFHMTKAEVDTRFLQDMRKLCDEQIKDAPVALADCRGRGGKTSFGAETRYNFVRDHGVGYRPRPNLTGQWRSATDSISPPWVLKQSSRAVTATWHGNQADGHPGLTGMFTGTLVSYDPDQTTPPPRNDEVDGRYAIHEGSLAPTGTMSFVLDGKNPDQYTLKIGTSETTFVRVK